MFLTILLACGSSAELAKPHDPPAWPMDNLVVDPPTPAPEEVEDPVEQPVEEPEPVAPDPPAQ